MVSTYFSLLSQTELLDTPGPPSGAPRAEVKFTVWDLLSTDRFVIGGAEETPLVAGEVPPIRILPGVRTKATRARATTRETERRTHAVRTVPIAIHRRELRIEQLRVFESMTKF